MNCKKSYDKSLKKNIHLCFDKYIFLVSYQILEKFILDELNKLSKATGYSIKNLAIEFKDNSKNSTLAYFSREGDKPIGFCFYLGKFDYMSPNKIIDICRHEFAHFMVCMQNSGNHPKEPHGTKWKNICYSLGAIPSAHMNNVFTKHLV